MSGDGMPSLRRGSTDGGHTFEIPPEVEGSGWLVMLRHGESEGNVDSEVYKEKPTHALELKDKGKEQAKGAAKLIREKFMGGHCQVYVSPYTRTKQTWKSVKSVLMESGGIDASKQPPEFVERMLKEEAEEEDDAIAAAEEKLAEKAKKEGKEVSEKERQRAHRNARKTTKKGKRVALLKTQYEDDLIEQNYGNLAGVATITDAETEKQTFGRYFYRYPNGERVADVVKRTENLMKQLRTSAAEQRAGAQNVLIITHGVTFRAIMLNLLADIPGETNVERYDYFSNPGNCTLVAFKWPRSRFSLADAEWHHMDPEHDKHEQKKAAAIARGLGSSMKRRQKEKASKKKRRGGGGRKRKGDSGSDSDEYSGSDTDSSDDSDDTDYDSDAYSDSDDDTPKKKKAKAKGKAASSSKKKKKEASESDEDSDYSDSDEEEDKKKANKKKSKDASDSDSDGETSDDDL
eukprot:g2553.t1